MTTVGVKWLMVNNISFIADVFLREYCNNNNGINKYTASSRLKIKTLKCLSSIYYSHD